MTLYGPVLHLTVMTSPLQLNGKRPVVLSFTHNSLSDEEADLNVCESPKAAP
jgi:hypothetical protein